MSLPLPMKKLQLHHGGTYHGGGDDCLDYHLYYHPGEEELPHGEIQAGILEEKETRGIE
jgi:hypothetical protein